MPSGGEGAPSAGRRPLVLVGGLLAVAALVRVFGALDSLWLDEIWSLELAARARSALDVFTALHHDNNHYLNTLWLRALGPDAAWLAYRAPAVLAGVGTVVLAGWLEGRAGVRAGVLATALFAVSYPFVHYASEARGYGWVVLLSLAAFALLERHHRRGDALSAALFATTAGLGFLAHLTFLTVYVPLLAWSLWVTVARRPSLARAVRLMAAHVGPLGVLGALLLVDIRYLVRGGGPQLLPIPGWLDSWSYALGIPTGGVAALALGVAFMPVVLAGLRERTRRDPDAAVFFVLVLVFPVALLLALRTGYAPPRYFLASLTFGLLLTSRGLATFLEREGSVRLVGVALLLVVLLGNGGRVARFLADGRGDHRALVEYLATHTAGDTIRVGGDYDFGASMVLGYYERYLPSDLEIEYVPGAVEGEGQGGAAAPDAPPDWLLLHELGDAFDPPPMVSPSSPDPTVPGRYALASTFPKYGLSGWNWALYRRDPIS